ncbi:MAG: hypothetical protein Q8L88_01675 [Bacteroidota bacterium]|nr:hypothetical protein [Bacteroidota bacterium]
MLKQIRLFILALLFFIAQHAHAQGCSDAGFCTVNSLKPHTDDSIAIDKNNRFAFGLLHGKADNNVAVYSGYAEYGRVLNDDVRCDVKLSFLSQRGESTQRSGLSDIFFSATYSLQNSNTITLGLKIPLSGGNTEVNGLSLPMDYQSSLGTVDLLLGVGSQFHGINMVAALQQPLSQNKNRFFKEDYPVNSEFRKFTSTNNYKRSGDLLIRISYPIRINSTIVLTPSILPIYHLADDSYTTISGSDLTITGSKGTTVNMNLYCTYSLNQTDRIEVSAGFPVQTRSIRPDGLTRSYIVATEYQTTF